jgi:LacI family transcriptional regulator
MARVSSKQVADYAGVSIATVSHVINGTRFVRAETRQKVEDAISALNYRPNAVARGLATNSTREIGLVVSDIRNPFFTAAARGVEDEFITHHYNTIFCNTDEDLAREEQNLHLLAGQQIDGLIIAPTGERCEPLLALARSGVPIVQIDRASPGLDAPCVRVNNADGAYQAVNYLIGLGHRRIAYLMGLEAVSTQIDRLQGWRRALEEAGLPCDESLILRADPRFYATSSANGDSGDRSAAPRGPLRSAQEVMTTALTQPDRPSAYFAGTNQLALGALYAIAECGLGCPEDVSFISFDDQDWAPLFRPPLTVVRQPTYQLGQTAARLLLKMIQGEPAESPPPLAVELIIRASCGPPATGGG